MNFGQRQQIVICVVAGAIVCVFLLFWYLPLRNQMKTIRQTRTAQALTVAKGAADSKQLPALNEQLLQLQTKLGNYEANIPEQNTFGAFLGTITDLMNQNNLQEQEVKPGDEIKADKFDCIPVSICCKGKLSQIFELYRGLQALDRLIRIEQVKLSNDSAYKGQVSMETEAVIYYRARAG
jgi:Tfp pilus assembly protein PilO